MKKCTFANGGSNSASRAAGPISPGSADATLGQRYGAIGRYPATNDDAAADGGSARVTVVDARGRHYQRRQAHEESVSVAIFAFELVRDLLFRVENDVKLLRNRVRMLQMEHEKAQKKIQETAKKTDELI